MRVVVSNTAVDAALCRNNIDAGLQGIHTANYFDCVKCKEAKAALAKQAPKRTWKRRDRQKFRSESYAARALCRADFCEM